MGDDNRGELLVTRRSDRLAPMLLLLLITFLGAALRFYHSDKRLLWLDEIHTWQIINEPGSFSAMISRWWNTFVVSDPPLYYIFNYPFSGAARGASHLQLRLPGLLMGTAAVPLMYAIVRLWESRKAALLGALLMAINTFAIQYSQEYRPYSQLLFAGMLYLHAQLLISRKFTWGRWGYLLLSAAVLIYTHYFGGFALASGYILWVASNVLKRRRQDPDATPWVAVLLLPVVLTAFYVPVLLYGARQAKHYSVAIGPDSEAARQIKEMYLNNKANVSLWTNLPYSFVGWYLGIVPLRVLVAVIVLAAAGLVRLAVKHTRTLIPLVIWTLLAMAISYGFYEIMKYPYEPRRNIFQLPVYIFLLVQGVLAITEVIGLLRRQSIAVKLLSRTAGFAIVVCLLALYARNYAQYDNYGFRSGFADWQSMANFLSRVRTDSQFIIAPVSNGANTQYGFYHDRVMPDVDILPDVERDKIEARLKKSSGIWFITTDPWSLSPATLDLLVSAGQWKVFSGGAVVFLPPPTTSETSGTAQRYVLADSEMTAAVAAVRSPVYADVTLSGPLAAKLRFDNNPGYALLNFPEGVHQFEIRPTAASNNQAMTTWSLYKKVQPGEWQAATEFDQIEPSTPQIYFPVYEGAPDVSMKYNGNLRYRFYVAESGSYDITFLAKSDKPGPVTARVFISGNDELPYLSFGKADNKFSEVKRRIKLNAGINEMVIYYNSFRRIPEPQWDPEDEFNQFEFVRWRIDNVAGAGAGGSL